MTTRILFTGVLIIVALMVFGIATTKKESRKYIRYVGPYTLEAYEAAEDMINCSCSPLKYDTNTLEAAYKIISGQ
jgi:hypothetical protein